MTNIARIAWDCFIDLGITVVYATIAGLLIVGVVASDEGTASLIKSALYASLLPLSVMALIVGDVAVRVLGEHRAVRSAAAR
jgi:hypothetical protein